MSPLAPWLPHALQLPDNGHAKIKSDCMTTLYIAKLRRTIKLSHLNCENHFGKLFHFPPHSQLPNMSSTPTTPSPEEKRCRDQAALVGASASLFGILHLHFPCCLLTGLFSKIIIPSIPLHNLPSPHKNTHPHPYSLHNGPHCNGNFPGRVCSL